MSRYRLAIAFFIALLCMTATASVFAQSESVTPTGAADAIRQHLFDAQSETLGQDKEAAQTAAQQALDIYNAALANHFQPVSPEINTALMAAFQQAIEAAGSGDGLALAVARGEIRSRIFEGSTAMLFNALQNSDGDEAHMWLLLRDYRKATKFSRPGADATLAVQGVMDGTSSGADALQAARNDLLDTYQAQLTLALADGDLATSREFSMRRAEEAGLASGYFEVLSAPYSDQFGADALAEARTAFDALTDAAIANDLTAYQTARQQIDTVLHSFRAAPLSDAEQARRAGQFLRFLSLVPVEYERGVRDGKVVKEIEMLRHKPSMMVRLPLTTTCKLLWKILTQH